MNSPAHVPPAWTQASISDLVVFFLKSAVALTVVALIGGVAAFAVETVLRAIFR